MKTFPSKVIGLLCVAASFSAYGQSAGGGGVSFSSASLVLSSNHSGGMLTVNNSKPVLYTSGAIGGASSLNIYNYSSGVLNTIGTLNRTGNVPITLQTGLTSEGASLTLNRTATFTSGGSISLSSGSTLDFGAATSGLIFDSGIIGSTRLTASEGATLSSGLTISMASGSTIYGGGVTVSGGTATTVESLIKTGAGTTVLNAGTFNYTGSTNISSGVINLTSGGTFAATTNTGILTGATLNVSGGSITPLTVSGATLSLGGTITGNSYTSSGTLILAAGNTYSGITTVSGGTLTLNGGTIGSTGTTVGGGILTTGGGVLSTGGGAGSITLSGNNVYTGTTTINGGSLQLNTGVFSGSNTLTLSGSGTIIGLNQILLGSGTLSGAGINLGISGTGSMTMNLPTNLSVPFDSISLPTSKQLTVNVAAGTPLNKIPMIKENTTTSLQTSAKFLDGVNTNGGGVSMLYLPAVQSLASDPFSVHLSELATAGTSEKFVLQMTYDPTAAAALGDVLNLYLAWYDPADSTWKDALDGNSDGGASSQFVAGAYDSTVDSALGTYGVDTTNSTVWAVVDHDGTFAVANSDVTPGTSVTPSAVTAVQLVPEPSSAVLLACGLGLLGRRRRKA